MGSGTLTDTGTNCKGLRISFWGVAIALGAAYAWATRYAINPNGISYLDMGDAYWRGDWHMAINAYWSPLYSWILGFILKVLKPSPYWEYPLVHFANLLIYVAALACFEFFLGAFIRYRRESGNGPVEADEVALPEWAWWALGYSLFIWTSLVLITIRLATPDMCVAGFVYLATGLILQIRSRAAHWRTFVLLGVVLGFAYLAKAVMFPLAFIFLAVAMLSLGNLRKAAPRVAISALIFLAIAAPFLVAISRAKGRLTFGDSGRVTYEVLVNGVDAWFPSSTLLIHPPRKIFEMPATFEFEKPIGGTYPPWYDPSYWHEGIDPHFDVIGEAGPTTSALIIYGWILFSLSMQLNVTIGLLMIYFLAPRPWLCLKHAASNWPLIIPALSVFGLYYPINTESRFIGEFVLLLWLAAFSGARLPASRESRRMIARVITAVAATSIISVAWYTFHNLTDARNAEPLYWQAASSLAEKGIKPTDKLALVWDEEWGKAAVGGALVARLAGVQIIAEVPRQDGFWSATPFVRSQVIQALGKTAAKAILTIGEPPHSAPDMHWERLGTTDYYLCRLQNGGS